jgi:hypothetical protein
MWCTFVSFRSCNGRFLEPNRSSLTRSEHRLRLSNGSDIYVDYLQIDSLNPSELSLEISGIILLMALLKRYRSQLAVFQALAISPLASLILKLLMDFEDCFLFNTINILDAGQPPSISRNEFDEIASDTTSTHSLLLDVTNFNHVSDTGRMPSPACKNVLIVIVDIELRCIIPFIPVHVKSLKISNHLITLADFRTLLNCCIWLRSLNVEITGTPSSYAPDFGFPAVCISHDIRKLHVRTAEIEEFSTLISKEYHFPCLQDLQLGLLQSDSESSPENLLQHLQKNLLDAVHEDNEGALSHCHRPGTLPSLRQMSILHMPLRLWEEVARLASDDFPLKQLELSEPKDHATAVWFSPAVTPPAQLSLKPPNCLKLILLTGLQFVSDALRIVSLTGTQSLVICMDSDLSPESDLGNPDLGDLECDTPVLSSLSITLHSMAQAMKLAIDLFPRLRRSALTSVVGVRIDRFSTNPAWTLRTPEPLNVGDLLGDSRLSQLSVDLDNREECFWHLLTGKLLDGVEELYVTFNSPPDPLRQIQNLLQSLRVQSPSQMRLPNLKMVYITLNCRVLRPVSASMVDDWRIWFTWVLQTREQNGCPFEYFTVNVDGEEYFFELETLSEN